jgi:hypothetical protein
VEETDYAKAEAETEAEAKAEETDSRKLVESPNRR